MTVSGKKVLLIIIDALTARVMEPAIAGGLLPNLARLRQAGEFSAENVSIFPSITHAALSSIVTGVPPLTHNILGCHWYRADEREVVYFSSEPEIILNQGIATFAEEFMLRLNHSLLGAKTLFQVVEDGGDAAASFNFLIFHGDERHKVNMPFLLKLIPNFPEPAVVYGPQILYLGDFVKDVPAEIDTDKLHGGPLNWFGFHDNTTGDLLLQFAQNRLFPRFTLAYFPRNDSLLHAEGPEDTLEQLLMFDSVLGEMFEAFGGQGPFLQEMCVIITGDHAQSAIVEEQSDAAIDLSEILSPYQITEPGTPWGPDDELMVCPNLRAAQIYAQQWDAQMAERLMATLLEEPRIDQILTTAQLAGGSLGYRVLTRERGELTFWAGEDGPHSARDVYGNGWSWDGDLAAVDGTIQEGVVEFGDYPNCFQRLSETLGHPHSGQLWLTAAVGYEFALPESQVHAGGGSHGSLHRLDSETALLIAGAPDSFRFPAHPRITDIAPICKEILGIDSLA